jgi:hypothetical protein
MTKSSYMDGYLYKQSERELLPYIASASIGGAVGGTLGGLLEHFTNKDLTPEARRKRELKGVLFGMLAGAGITVRAKNYMHNKEIFPNSY